MTTLYPQNIVWECALKYCGESKADLMSPYRRKTLVQARQGIVGVCRDLSIISPSYPELASLLGRRFHSTAWGQYDAWTRWPAERRETWKREIREMCEKQREAKA